MDINKVFIGKAISEAINKKEFVPPTSTKVTTKTKASCPAADNGDVSSPKKSSISLSSNHSDQSEESREVFVKNPTPPERKNVVSKEFDRASDLDKTGPLSKPVSQSEQAYRANRFSSPRGVASYGSIISGYGMTNDNGSHYPPPFNPSRQLPPQNMMGAPRASLGFPQRDDSDFYFSARPNSNHAVMLGANRDPIDSVGMPRARFPLPHRLPLQPQPYESINSYVQEQPSIPVGPATLPSPTAALAASRRQVNNEMISVMTRWIQSGDVVRLVSFVADHIGDISSGKSAPASGGSFILTEEVLVSLMSQCCEHGYYSDMLQMIYKIPLPSVNILVNMTRLISQYRHGFVDSEKAIWAVFNKCFSWHLENKAVLTVSIVEAFVRCFSSVGSWSRLWNALHLCYKQGNLPATSVSLSSLKILLSGLGGAANSIKTKEKVDGHDESLCFSLELTLHLLAPFYPSKSTGAPISGAGIGVLCEPLASLPSDFPRELLVHVWLRCLERGNLEWAIRIGGEDGSLVLAPAVSRVPIFQTQDNPGAKPIIEIIKSHLEWLISLERMDALADFLLLSSHFLPLLSDSIAVNLLMLAQPHLCLLSLINQTTLKIKNLDILGAETRELSVYEVRRCLAYVFFKTATSFSERGLHSQVVVMHAGLRTSSLGLSLVSETLEKVNPQFSLQYGLLLLETAAKLCNWDILHEALSEFGFLTQPTDNVSFRNRRYLCLKNCIEAAQLEANFEVAVDAFFVLQTIFDDDLIAEFPVDVNQVFNELLMRACLAPGDTVRRGLELGHRALSCTKTRLVILACPLRILLTESVRQGCCSSSSSSSSAAGGVADNSGGGGGGPSSASGSSTGGSNAVSEQKRCVFELAERGFNVGIYPRADVLPDKRLLLATDCTAEELQVIIVIYCRNLRQHLLQVASQGTDAVVDLCQLAICAHPVGLRDPKLVGQYHVDATVSGVLTRMGQVLAAPMFLHAPIDFVREGVSDLDARIVVDKNKLYNSVYYSSLDF